MSSLPDTPAWLYEVPHPAELTDDSAHPDQQPVRNLSDLTDEELADWLGPDSFRRNVTSSVTGLILDPLWWSLGNAAEYIDVNTDNGDAESSTLFRGFNRIEAALRSGELQAYGSIDAGPLSVIPVEAWPEFVMVASNIAPNAERTMTYDISIRSVRSYRAAALDDHSFPSGDLVPSALEPQGEPGYHRIISDAFVKESDVRKLITLTTSKSRQRRIGEKQQRLIATLGQLKIKGQKVFPDRGKIPIAEITRAVIKVWIKEDERRDRQIEYNPPSEEQAIRRFYLSPR